MKKAFIIGFIAALALIVLFAPVLVGELILRWAPAQIEVIDPLARWEARRGWRRSSVRFTLSDGTEGELHGRHLPLAPPALLAFHARVQPAGQPAPAEIHGRMGLLGGLVADGDMAGMNLQAGDTRIVLHGVVMALDTRGAPRDQTLALQADTITLRDRPGNWLALAETALGLRWRRDGDHGRLAVRLDTRRDDQPGSVLALDVRNIAPEPLARLVEALLALRQAGTNDFHQQMLMLGVLNAWQELGAAALTAELHELVLDQAYTFSGRWRFDRADDTNIVEGRGSNEALLGWLAPVAGLSTGQPPDSARRVARDMLDQMEQHDWLIPENGHSRFRLTAREAQPITAEPGEGSTR